MSENSIEFSLSIAEQRAVGFIPAWSLASLHYAFVVSPEFFLFPILPGPISRSVVGEWLSGHG